MGSPDGIFFSGCFCKGFNSYDEAWNFLLDIPKEPDIFSHIRDSNIPPEPPEPPEPPIPTEPDDLNMNHCQQPTQHTSSHVVPNDTTDEESLATYDYNLILPPHHQVNTTIPAKVHVPPSTTNNTTTSYDSNNTPPTEPTVPLTTTHNANANRVTTSLPISISMNHNVMMDLNAFKLHQ